MKVKELCNKLLSIDDDCEVKVILNDYVCKDIDTAYFSIRNESFNIYVVDDKRSFLDD